MCYECGCETVGSTKGVTPVTITDASRDGDSGLTQLVISKKKMAQEPLHHQMVQQQVPLPLIQQHVSSHVKV
jgi:hypothetical protein